VSYEETERAFAGMESSLCGGLVSVALVFCSLSGFPFMLLFPVSTPPVPFSPAHTSLSCSIWRAVLFEFEFGTVSALSGVGCHFHDIKAASGQR
jgi:hypothetical protein